MNDLGRHERIHDNGRGLAVPIPRDWHRTTIFERMGWMEMKGAAMTSFEGIYHTIKVTINMHSLHSRQWLIGEEGTPAAGGRHRLLIKWSLWCNDCWQLVNFLKMAQLFNCSSIFSSICCRRFPSLNSLLAVLLQKEELPRTTSRVLVEAVPGWSSSTLGILRRKDHKDLRIVIGSRVS